MNGDSKERKVIKASVLVGTQRQLKALAKDHGCTQQALFGRVLDWFAAQPKIRRVAIFNAFSDEDTETYADEVKEKREAVTAKARKKPKKRKVGKKKA